MMKSNLGLFQTFRSEVNFRHPMTAEKDFQHSVGIRGTEGNRLTGEGTADLVMVTAIGNISGRAYLADDILGLIADRRQGLGVTRTPRPIAAGGQTGRAHA